MSAILGFLAEIRGVQHKAALFNFTGKDFYWCSWMDAMCGTLFHFDLTTGKQSVFAEVQDFHGSYHQSGQRHDKVRTARKVNEAIGVRKLGRPEDLMHWQSLRSVTVPLDQPFTLPLTQGPWNEVERPIVLRKEDFNETCGLTLHGFACPAKLIPQLVRRWNLKYWMAGTDNLRLVVLAEPSKLPPATKS